jgi:enediyne biosynthesis protein E4
VEKQRFIVHNRLVLIDQLPAIKRRFETFNQYATTSFEKAFSKDDLDDAYTATAFTFTSSVLKSRGGKQFTIEPLPELAQVSTLNDFVVEDFNGDGWKDLMLSGNNYRQETMFGRYDASIGLILINNQHGGWTSLDNPTTGLLVDGDVRHTTTYNAFDGKHYLFLLNNDSSKTFIQKGTLNTAVTKR